MESLAITERPTRWAQVVGQDRAVKVLQSILEHGKFLPRGVILEGPYGTGKTTIGYILARALMCTGGDPLGCGKCASCMAFDESPESHPEFREIDAACFSGVDAARRVLAETLELPSLGRTRVVLIDEAHKLSEAAWTVYLKPLEQLNTTCVFIFATTDGTKIPPTIRSRCSKIPLNKVPSDVILGLLVSIASRSGKDYEMDGLKLIARSARGHVRDALDRLDTAAGQGKITYDLVSTLVDTAYEEHALNVLLYVAGNRLPEAITTLDTMACMRPAGKVIGEVFAAYGRAVFGGEEFTPDEAKRYNAVKAHFDSPAPVTALLLKWSTTDRIPTDALPLFALELHQLRSEGAAKPIVVASAPAIAKEDPLPSGSTRSGSALAHKLGAKIIT